MRARADVEVGLGIVMLAGVQTSGVSPSKPLDRIAWLKKHGHLTFFLASFDHFAAKTESVSTTEPRSKPLCSC
jgi:hypothetical protein